MPLPIPPAPFLCGLKATHCPQLVIYKVPPPPHLGKNPVFSCVYVIVYLVGSKNVVKAIRKVGQGKVKAEGEVWFTQLHDRRM